MNYLYLPVVDELFNVHVNTSPNFKPLSNKKL